MTPNLFEPRRLRESPERPSSIEGRLARQLRVLSVYAPTPQLRRYSVLPRRRRYLLTAVRVAAVATIVLAVSGVATATATYVIRRVWAPPAAVDRVPSLPALGTHAGRPATLWGLRPSPSPAAQHRMESPAEQPGLLAPRKSRSVAAMDADSVATQPRRPPEQVPRAPAQTFEPPALPSLPLPIETPPTGTTATRPSGRAMSQVRADGVTQEAGLLRQALSALRRDHDARRALALLDDYDRRFGQGALAAEAASSRAQALLQLGDNARALEILDRLPLQREGHTGELRLIRGELRSLSGRCRDALLDFDAVLSASRGSAPDEVARGLFGRASCRARTGDLAGAEQDRRRYLKEFPQGPAARQLSSPP